MAGSLLDLGQPETRLPTRFVVDSSLIIPRLRSAQSTLTPIAAVRARQSFQMLRAAPTIGLVPPTAYSEVLHYALKAHFRDLLPTHRAELMAAQPRKRGFDWLDLYKQRPDLISRFRAELEILPSLLRANGLAVLQPIDLEPLPTDLSWEEALTRLVVRYELDSSDAAILFEGQRAGITSIATLDADLRRAALDFDVYTWL